MSFLQTFLTTGSLSIAKHHAPHIPTLTSITMLNHNTITTVSMAASPIVLEELTSQVPDHNLLAQS
jgi:hypothetical protein